MLDCSLATKSLATMDSIEMNATFDWLGIASFGLIMPFGSPMESCNPNIQSINLKRLNDFDLYLSTYVYKGAKLFVALISFARCHPSFQSLLNGFSLFLPIHHSISTFSQVFYTIFFLYWVEFFSPLPVPVLSSVTIFFFHYQTNLGNRRIVRYEIKLWREWRQKMEQRPEARHKCLAAYQIICFRRAL